MIKSETLYFLTQLKDNNERDWFQNHKADHDSARENVLNLVEEIIIGLSKIDNTISADLNPKDCVMRIYRDVRFSKDKTPYKTNFGAGISSKGKNFNGPGYYLHIEPNQSFLAGGCWFPEAKQLKAIRQEIDYNSSEFYSIIENNAFKNYFGKLDVEAALKTAPKGYSPDNPNLEYLKLKSFTASHILTTKELSSPNMTKIILNGFEKLYPFMCFLRNAID